MQAKIKERIGKIGFKAITIIGVMIFLCLVQLGSSLEFAISSESPNIYEDETLILNISISEVNGTLNFTKNVSFGELNKTNETLLQFNWTPEQALLTSKTNTFSVLFYISDNSSSLSKEVTITVTKRNDPPRIINSTLGGLIYQSRTEIFLELDRESVCKYSFSNKNYSSMEYTFNSNDNKTLHNATTPKMSQGTKKIYILCRDFSENYMEEPHIITFDVNLAPTATIYLEPSPPLKSERVFVELVSSEELASAPELSYTFDDDQSPKIVSLVGSGRRWEGYMIIRGTNIERVGSFSFRGVDLSGIEGTEITDGKLFLIDTNKPGPVQSIEVTNQYDRTRLAWAYSLERDYNIVEYRIYRRVDSGGVDYVDYYKSTTNNYFYDKDVELKKGYYYRVSAVDDAGNEGELSKEVFTTFIPKVLTESSEDNIKEETYKLSPALIIVLESKIDIIDQMLLDLNKKEEYFKRISGTENIEVVQSLKILEEVKSAKEKTSEIKDEMLNLKSKNLTELEFTDAVDQLIKNAQTEFDTAPSEIKIIDSLSYQEFIDEDIISEMAKAYLIAKENSYESVFKELKENSILLQDKITVNVLLIESEIVYPKETKNVKTVKKTLNSKETINDAILAESLPKDLSYDFQKLIINEEPTLREEYSFFWEEPKLTKKTIVYSLIDYPDFTTLKNSKLILLSSPKSNENVSGITGLTVSDTQKGASPLIIPIIIGIILAGLLGIYYFISVKQEDNPLSSNPFDVPKKSNLKDLFQSIYPKKALYSKIMPKEFADAKSVKLEDREKLLNLEKEEPADLIQKSTLFIQKDKDMRFRQTSDSDSSVYNKRIPKENAFDSEIDTANMTDFMHSNKEGYVFNKEKKSLDIKRIYNDIIRYKQELERGKEIDINDMQNIKETLKGIKFACDEIDKASIENYTEKAKIYLRDTLRYLENMEFAKEDLTKNTEREQLQKISNTKGFKNNISSSSTNKKHYKLKRKEIIANNNKNKTKDNFHNLRPNSLKMDIHEFAPNNKFFSLQNGLLLRNISELIDYLEVIDKELFLQHANFSKNDFSRWVKDVFGAEELSKSIDKILDPKEMRKKIIEFF